jgi:hypothetical protein
MKKTELTQPEKSFIKWYKGKYLNFPTDDHIKKKLDDTKNDYLLTYGSYNRIKSFLVFGYFLNIDITNTICTTFKIRDLNKNIEAIYSFGYYESIKNIKVVNKEPVTGVIPSNSNYNYKYFTMGGSFISKDGEYRVGMFPMINFYHMENIPNITNLVNEMEIYLKEKLFERKMILFKEFFYPTDTQKSLENELEYYSYKIQQNIFVLSWFNDMFNIHLNIVENHLNETYKQIMFKYKNEDLDFFKKLIKKYGMDKIEELRYISNHIMVSKSNNTMIGQKVGQKIIPLSISEAQNPFDVKFKPWREYLVSVKLSNLVVNNISPGFFVTNSWFYIKNSRKGLFDNEIQYDKMARSELAIQITELLTRAQIYTQENISSLHKLSNTTIDSWISNKFRNLHDKIQHPIDYAKDDIIMSNVALCMISEYVGRTIVDVITLSKSSTYYNNLIGQPFTSKGFPVFTKYMFDLCYNLYCMNYKCGIIHGDLHLNNATLNTISYKNVKNINDIENPNVLYVLGDTDEQYIFPTVGYYTCIIDFSRCIILPEKIDELQDDSIPKSYSIVKNLKEFHNIQVQSLLNIYLHYTSDSISNKDELMLLFKNQFEAVFKLLSVTDLYGFTKKMLTMFSIKDKTIIEPSKMIIELLEKINKNAEHYIIVEMNKLIFDKTYEKTILEMEWPIYTIIKNCFSDYSIKNRKIENIIDVYNINNKMEYSLNKMSNYPSFIRDSENKEKRKTLIAVRKTFEKNKNKGLQTINFIANRQKQKHI